MVEGSLANLVTEEQRVRYNTGGRVALGKGDWLMNIGKKIPGVDRLTKWGASKIPKKLQPGSINPQLGNQDLLSLGFHSLSGVNLELKILLPLYGKSIAGKGVGWAKGLGKKMFDRPGSSRLTRSRWCRLGYF